MPGLRCRNTPRPLRQADLLRRERHRAVYGGIDFVPRSDVEASLQLVHQLLPILKEAALAALDESGVGGKDKRGKDRP